MKKIVLLVCMLLTAMTAMKVGAVAEGLDKIVAVVNDDVVTQSELNKVVALLRAQFAQAHKNLPATPVLREQALNDLINKKLQLQIAKQVGITITNADLDRVVQGIASRNNLSVADLYGRLQQEGVSTDAYRDEMREQLTVQRLQQQEAGGQQILVTPEEIDRVMHNRPERPRNHSSQEFHLEDILVALPDNPSGDDLAAALKRARAVMALWGQGKRADDITKATADDRQPLASDDLGWRKFAEVPTAFASYLSKMKPNDVAGPIRTPNGLHIIRLADTRVAAGEGPSADVGPSREQVQQMLLQRKFAEHVQTWLSKVRSQAFISLK